jgi:hypothetical protein
MTDRLQQLADRARQLGWTRPIVVQSPTTMQELRGYILAMERNSEADIRFVEARVIRPERHESGEVEYKIEVSVGDLNSRADLEAAGDALQNMWRSFLAHLRGRLNLRATDQFQIRVLGNDQEASTDYLPFKDHNVASLTSLLFGFSSGANYEINLNDATIRVVYDRQRGGNGFVRACLSAEEFIKKKRCLVEITGGHCFYQCCILTLAYHHNRDQYNMLKKKQSQAHRITEAIRFKDMMGFPNDVSLGDIEAIEQKCELSIYVIDYRNLRYVYESKEPGKQPCFMLRTGDEEQTHYTFINPDKPGALWSKRQFCYTCMRAYHDLSHTCFALCKRCRHPDCPDETNEKRCRICLLKFKNAFCYDVHLKKKMCEKERLCEICMRLYSVDRKHPHVCNKHYCKICDELYEGLHECYVQPVEQLKPISNHYIFYDYECTLDDGVHNVAGIVAMTLDDPTPREFKTTDGFINWVCQKKHKGYTCIGHNASRYDFHFVKKIALERGLRSYDVATGHTIYYSEFKDFKIRWIDSYRFIPISLRSFPKTFCIEELAKGYFPYIFFTQERIDYTGPMPDKKWFEFDHYKEKDREEAIEWYETHKNDEIDLYRMCMDYCISDVALLREGCIRFRNLFLSITQNEMDPFQYLTIASVCLQVYLRFYYPEKTIARLPLITDRLAERSWLAHIAQEKQVSIRPFTGMSGIDEHGQVYRFRYCLDDGCKSCFNVHTFHPTQGIKLHELHYASRKAIEQHNAISIWECQWTMPEDAFTPLLNPRNAFFGGRTEPIKMYYKCQEGETIRYYDYTSLYPSIQFGRIHGITAETYDELQEIRYPVGHPEIITHDFLPLDQYFGFVKCEIKPAKLYIPLIPTRGKGKLIFDCEPKSGTWTTIEVCKAIELGYVVEKIFCVWHFPTTSDTLFRDYVKTFLKIKQQSAGWSKLGCHTEEEKKEFIDYYEQAQGIRLEHTEYNPGMYYVAKLCLNSLWGKFGQRPYFTSTQDTFGRDDFEEIVYSDKYLIHDVIIHPCGARSITYEKKRRYVMAPKHSNIAIAAFTTSHARLRLYQALEVLQDRVLYMDTDSVIFVDRGDPGLVTGPLLGDLTDELDDDEIIEFISAGPKCYGYETKKGKKEFKIKGFTLNVKTSKVLNFDTVKDIVLHDRKRKIQTFPLQFQIDAYHNIKTKKFKEDEEDQGKYFQFTFDKREICPRQGHFIDTVPYASDRHAQDE